MSDHAIEEVRERLAGARRVVLLTGAGVSAESGVPTFRGAGGLWKSHRPEDLATPEAFARSPALVWEWYQWRREVVAACEPNAGHRALARLALQREGVVLATQNVDGLHHRAADAEAATLGLHAPDRAYPLEVHGALHRDRCSGCGALTSASTEASGPPPCRACGALLRPDVVWFGEALDPDVISAAASAAAEADVCIVAGTSGLVYPAAGLPEVTLRAGGTVVEVNLEPTPLTRHATFVLQGQASELLPRIVVG